MKNSKTHKAKNHGKETKGRKTRYLANRITGEGIDRTVDDLIKAKGLRSTFTRRVILAHLAKAKQPLAVDQLLSTLNKPKRAKFDVVTLYRNMKAFEEVGLISAIDLGRGKVFYEFTQKHPHHHHHIVCERCHVIRHLDVCGLDAHFKMLEGLGYKKVKHKLEFSGLCRACR